MLFNSLTFFAFIAVVLPLYHVLERRNQNVMLLLASYVFYGYWDWRFVSLIWVSTAVDYIVGLAMERADEQRRRRALLFVSLATNLGLLGFFKYFGFFVDSFVELIGAFGLESSRPLLNVVLPVGISFYTFQTLSYTIDIYRRKSHAIRDPLTFALFVAYFPQLVAGPIERAKNLLPRLQQQRSVSWPGIAVGVELIALGYFKKVGVADTLGPLVDLRFENPALASGSDLLLSVYLFSIQIYCDFSGYTDIARGLSKLFGIELMRNFEQPYFSRSVTEFWRRWHISLSTWLRDYLYISLGGNRRGRLCTYRNLMVTMLLGGLWHGASWTFVAWGALHGLYLACERFFVTFRGVRPPTQIEVRRGVMRSAIAIVLTFHLVAFTWIFFRAESFDDATAVITGIITWRESLGTFAELSWTSPRIVLLIGVLIVYDVIQARSGYHAFVAGRHWIARGLGYTTLVGLTLLLGNLDQNVPFIYFQF